MTQNGLCGLGPSFPGVFKMHRIGCHPGEGIYFRCFFFFCKWCDDMLLLIFIRPLYPECVLESWPPSSGDPGQWNIWSDCSRTRQTDADSARPLWRRALGSGPAPQEATSCDRQRWPLCKVRPQQWLSSPYFFGITGLFCPNLPVA